ncbi:hypothetical protein HAX54_033426 [Datura stramonium]|uniref:Uncharacterized protein n=1 Tax=Datura stramonium TaxID=4076 RepID=A0ABS8VDP5_DATST|nr:hypothetical protein [Datura stramonium]
MAMEKEKDGRKMEVGESTSTKREENNPREIEKNEEDGSWQQGKKKSKCSKEEEEVRKYQYHVNKERVEELEKAQDSENVNKRDHNNINKDLNASNTSSSSLPSYIKNHSGIQLIVQLEASSGTGERKQNVSPSQYSQQNEILNIPPDDPEDVHH